MGTVTHTSVEQERRSGRQLVGFLRGRKLHTALSNALSYVILLTGAAVSLLPFFWMISTSLKAPHQIYVFPPIWIPDPFVWENFWNGWVKAGFNGYAWNTTVITLTSLVGALLSSSLVAFGFARLKARGKNALFVLVLSTMMLPHQVTMIPTFILFKQLGWVNTYLPLIVPSWFASAFQVFLLRQFFMTIPLELDDAARIDGCSSFGIFWRMIVPLSGPALAAIGIFHFMGHWDDFMGPLIYINSREKWTISLGLRSFQGEFDRDLGPLMASSLVALLPCVIIFFFAQRYFIRGVALTGIKG